ncbi:MAG: hypothetical protein ABI440_05735 [Casimicrobiaceae bacterium]
MHIVIACWLYVIAMVALTLKGAIAGFAMFVFVGCAPVCLYLWVAVQRLRQRRAATTPPADA